LKIFAKRVQESLRSFDLVARLGGEEFVVILPDVSTDMAYFVAERLRRAIADEPFACGVPDGLLKVTTSIGGTIVSGGSMPMEDILKQADDALYKAKQTGRNGTVFHDKGRLDPAQYMQEARAFME